MATNTAADEVIVGISADTSKMRAGLEQAQNQFKSFTNEIKTGMAASNEAMFSADAAAKKTAESVGGLGEKLRETGSRRELSESMRVLRGAAMGTGGAFEALQGIVMTFGETLGGPALMLIVASIAGLTALISHLKSTSEEQEKLNTESEMFSLPKDRVEAFSKDLDQLVWSLTQVTEGFGHFSEAQKEAFSQFGIIKKNDPTEMFTKIRNAMGDSKDAIKEFAIQTGLSLNDATGKWNELNKKAGEVAKTVSTKEMIGYTRGGDVIHGTRDITYGEEWGLNKKPTGDKTVTQTQTQIDDAKKTNQTLLKEKQDLETKQAEIIKNGVQKEIALGKARVDALKQQQAQELKDFRGSNEQKAQLVAEQAGIMAALQTSNTQAVIKAHKDADKKILEARKQLTSELKAFGDETSAAQVESTTNQLQKIIKDADNKVASIKAKLAADLVGVTNPKNRADLTSAADKDTEAQLQARQTKIIEELNKEKLTNKQAYEAASKQMDNDGAFASVNIAVSAADKIRQAEQKLLADKKKLLDEDLANTKLTADQKKQIQNDYNNQVIAITKSANAQIQAAQSKPVDQLMAKWKDTASSMDQLWATSMSDMSSGLTDFVMSGKMNFASFTQAIILDLIKIQIQKEIAGIFGDVMGAFSGGFSQSINTTAGMTGPTFNSSLSGFAGGGTVQPGVPTMVGERGPEMFVPNVGGSVVNNSDMKSGKSTPNVSVQIQNNGTAQTVTSAKPTMTGSDLIVQVVLNDIKSNGKISNGLQSQFGLNNKTYL